MWMKLRTFLTNFVYPDIQMWVKLRIFLTNLEYMYIQMCVPVEVKNEKPAKYFDGWPFKNT